MLARLILLILLTAANANTAVYAAEEQKRLDEKGKFYVGLGTGSLRLKKLSTKSENRILSLPGVVGVVDVKKDGNAKKIFFGYKPWETTSFELTYLEATDFHVRLLASNSLIRFSSEKEGEVKAIGLSVKKDWPLGNKFSVYGTLGVYRYQLYVKMDASDGLQTLAEEDAEYGNTISATAGVAYRLGRKWTLAAEAERNGAKVNYVTITRKF